MSHNKSSKSEAFHIRNKAFSFQDWVYKMQLTKIFEMLRFTPLLLLFLLSSIANGQFTKVINIPETDPDIGRYHSLDSNTQLNLSEGGTIGLQLLAGMYGRTSSNIEVNIMGGTVFPDFNAYAGSTINISGGIGLHEFRAREGSVVNISGGNVGRNFIAFDQSRVNIYGGSVDYGFLAISGSFVNITGGNIGSRFQAFPDSTVNISGGNFGSFFGAHPTSILNISGGEFNSHFQSYDGSVVNISGGYFGRNFDAESGSLLNISGGIFGDKFEAFSDSEVRLIGREFYIGDLNIAGLADANVLLVDPANYSQLTGVLADGTYFSFDEFFAGANFRSGSLLSVMLLKEDFLVGDYNDDGNIDIADYNLWKQSVGKDSSVLANNIHMGNVGQPEYDTLIEAHGAVFVPEPSTLIFLLLGLATTAIKQTRA